MKKTIPFLIMIVLGVIARFVFAEGILGRITQGTVSTVNEMRVYPQAVDSFSSTNIADVWTLTTNSIIEDPFTSNFYPSFQSSSLYSEPLFNQGRAWEFVVNGYYVIDGGSIPLTPWVNPQNVLFDVANNGNPDLRHGFSVTIDGELAGYPGSEGFVLTNLKMYDEWHDLLVADGVLDYRIIGSNNVVQTLYVPVAVYSYSVDGVEASPGQVFTLSIFDGTHTAFVVFPCQAGSTGVVAQVAFAGTVNLNERISTEVAITGATCTSNPTFGLLKILFEYMPAP
jgi:hypothetical protein